MNFLSYQDVLAQLPTIRSKILLPQNLTILCLAGSEERRIEMNNLIDLNGEKYPTYQTNIDSRIYCNSLIYPFEFDYQKLRGRTYMLVFIDKAIEEKYFDRHDYAPQLTINMGLCSVADVLGCKPKDLYFTV